jgi:hypothetical protein
MARINRSDVIQKAVNDLAISTASEKVPNETLDKVQLTYDLNKNFSNFILTTTATTTGAISIVMPTVSAGGEIYITGIQASMIKDATCDQATGRLTIQITPDSTNVGGTIMAIPILTLTAQSESLVYSLPYPVKVRPGSSATIIGTYTVGTMARSLSIVGYTTSSN